MRKKEKTKHVPIKEIDPDGEILRLAEWVKDTCLMFGAEPGTAFTVAGTFAHGLENSLRKRAENNSCKKE